MFFPFLPPRFRAGCGCPAKDTLMAFQIFITIFLVLLNGFFVAAEFAIVKVRSSQIEVRAQKNKAIAGIARTIVNNLDGYLAATQLGITLASLGLGWVGEKVMTHIVVNLANQFGANLSEETAGPIAIGVAFFIITVLHIVFGELAPKSLAIRYPSSTTFAVSLPLRVFYIVFRPFIWLLNGMANLILRIFGIRPVHGSDIHSEEELKMIITESHEGGAIEQTERELIQNVFDFDDRRVWDIQTLRKDITAMPANMSIKDAFDFANREGYSRYPVYGEDIDDIRGIINTKDLMRTLLTDTPPSDITPLVREAYFVSESKKIKDLLKEFQRKHVLLAITTNEVGEVAGIVTMEDVLEELVGEIQDEYDNEKPFVEQTERGTYLVNAHQKLSDINKYLPYRLDEDEHYDTLSGFISFHHAGELQDGDILTIDPYEITVLKMYRNSIETVELRLLDAESEAL